MILEVLPKSFYDSSGLSPSQQPQFLVLSLSGKKSKKKQILSDHCLFFSDVHIVSTLEPLSNAVKRNVPRCTITPVLLEQAHFRISVTCPSFVQTILIRLPKDVSTLYSNATIRLSLVIPSSSCSSFSLADILLQKSRVSRKMPEFAWVSLISTCDFINRLCWQLTLHRSVCDMQD